MRTWNVEQANAELPRVRGTVQRIQALVRSHREQADQAATKVHGNGHGAPGGEDQADTSALQAMLEELTRDGIVLRDVDNGLVDFPARSPSGRHYWLCWLLDEPEVAWWHWPETGFAGRRPLSDPPE